MLRRNKRSYDLIELHNSSMNNNLKNKEIDEKINYYNDLRKEIIDELQSNIKNKKRLDNILKKSDSETSFESNSSIDSSDDDIELILNFKKDNPKIVKNISNLSNLTDNSFNTDYTIDKNDSIVNIDYINSNNEKLLFVDDNINTLEEFLHEINDFDNENLV